MLYWAGIFFTISVVSGVLGFGMDPVASAGMVKFIFFFFTIGFFISMVLHFVKRIENKERS